MGVYVWTLDLGVLKEEEAGGGCLARLWRTRTPGSLCLVRSLS